VLVEGDLEQARSLGERMRLLVAEAHIPDRESAVTISAGAADYRDQSTLDDLTYRADQALLKAKEQGRNKVVGE